MSIVEELLGQMRGANKASDVKKVSSQFSDDILEYELFPDTHIDFLKEVLTKPEFYEKKGVFHFLALVGADTDIMSKEQLDAIAGAIIAGFPNYSDEMLNLTVCDFVARYYPNQQAKEVLLKLRELESKKTEKGFADDGLRILENEIKRQR